MSQPHIPQGCYSLKSAAQKLGIREENVLRKMRVRGWLYKGIFRKDPLTDMPLPDAIENGFLKKIKRNTWPPYDWEIAITTKGMSELGAKMQEKTHPTPKVLTLENAQKEQSKPAAATSNEEREKAMAQLREWGLAS